MKQAGEKITMLTAYDAVSAAIFDRAGVDMLLVGDSIGTTMFGYSSTIPVTVEEMIVATRSVVRGSERALIVADLPFGSYEQSPAQCVQTASRLVKDGGADMVKFEGAHPDLVAACARFGISVMGHLGFTPQSETALGGKKVQGRGAEATARLISDARSLQDAGASLIVLEMVPTPAAEAVTRALDIPTIGIGAGSVTDGQVLVWTDMAGMADWAPRFSKIFAPVGAALTQAAEAYVSEVRGGTFPDEEHSFTQ